MSRPSARSLRRAAVAGGLLAGLAVPSAAFAADPASTAVVLTTDNKISTFETAYPTEATAPVAVTGLVTGDKLVGIDVRPQNGQLYALGFNATDATIRLYALSSRTAIAKALGEPLPVGGTSATTQFGFDFNPAVDRVRVVADSGLNARLNPNDGTAIDADPVTAGVQYDTGTSPAVDKVDGAAYTNNKQTTNNVTTLYTLSGATNKLYVQTGTDGTPTPNDGEQTAGRLLKVAGIDLDFGAVGGFDIAPGVDATSNNGEAPAGGAGYAALKIPGGTTILAKIDLPTGNTTPLGPIGAGSTDVQGLAIQQEVLPGGLPSVALTTDATIKRFNSADLATSADSPTISAAPGAPALEAGDTFVSIDWRPQTGELLGLAVDHTANTGNLYRIDPQNGQATRIGTANSVAFETVEGTAIDLPDPAANRYDIDVNPTVDRVRVVTSNGLNFRLNPAATDAQSAAVDGNNGGIAVVANVNPDGELNSASADIGKDIFGTSYTNAFGQAAAIPATQPTTQYGLSVDKDQLLIQNPPNEGKQTAPLPLKEGANALNITDVRGFEIPPAVAVTANNAAAVGKGHAALTVGGVTKLYAIDLSTGAATAGGTFTAAPRSFVSGDGPAAPKDRTPPVVIPPVVVPPVVTPPVVTPPAKAGFGSSTKLSVKLRATRISRNGPAKVTFRNTNTFDVRVRIQATTPKSGKRKAIKYATKTYTIKKRSSRTVNVKLPKAARSVLSSKRKLTIKVTLRVTAPNGKSRTVRKTLTARRK